MHWQMKGIAAGDARLACALLAPLADSGPDPPSCFRSSKTAAASTSEQAPTQESRQTSKHESKANGAYAWCLLVRGDRSIPKCQRRALPGFVNWPLPEKQTEVVASSVQAPQR